MNVSKGDLAYIVHSLSTEINNWPVTVDSFAGSQKASRGMEPHWCVTSSKTFKTHFGHTIPAGSTFMAPDRCLRRISGPGIKVVDDVMTPYKADAQAIRPTIKRKPTKEHHD